MLGKDKQDNKKDKSSNANKQKNIRINEMIGGRVPPAEYEIPHRPCCHINGTK
jgi:hypothetical protein